MKIYNGTAHDICIIRTCEYNPNIRKYIAEKTIADKIIPVNSMLSAVIDTCSSDDDIDNIPTFVKEIKSCDPLPDGYDIYIVSMLYATAARQQGVDMHNIYTVADPVYSNDGKTILGCRGICQAL